MGLEYGPGEDAKDGLTGAPLRRKIRMVRKDKNGNLTLCGPFPREHRDKYLAKGFVEWDGKPLPEIPRSKAPTAAAHEAAEHLSRLVGKLVSDEQAEQHKEEISKRGPGRPKKTAEPAAEESPVVDP